MHSLYIIVKKNREFWSKFWVDKPACLQEIAIAWIQQFTRKIDNRNRKSLILLHFPLLTIMCNICPCIKLNASTVFSFSYILKMPQKSPVAPVPSEFLKSKKVWATTWVHLSFCMKFIRLLVFLWYIMTLLFGFKRVTSPASSGSWRYH